MADVYPRESFQEEDRHRSQGEDAVDEFFGWIGRDGMETIERASRQLLGIPLLQDLLDTLPIPVALLNENAQIVLLNRQWSQLIGEDVDHALGQRYGELLGCTHAADGSGGCGTSRHCARCGAFRSIVSSVRLQRNARHAYQLRRTTNHGVEVVDMVVTSTPIEVDGQTFSVFALQERFALSAIDT